MRLSYWEWLTGPSHFYDDLQFKFFEPILIFKNEKDRLLISQRSSLKFVYRCREETLGTCQEWTCQIWIQTCLTCQTHNFKYPSKILRMRTIEFKFANLLISPDKPVTVRHMEIGNSNEIHSKNSGKMLDKNWKDGKNRKRWDKKR